MPIATPPGPDELNQHPVVSCEEWLAARLELLNKEKELTRRNDELSAARRRLPWVRVEKNYRFETRDGRKTLDDLFDGRSQLIVYHFMFGPGWEEGCSGCTFLSDHFDGANLHLPHHDVTLVAVSRAPLAEVEPYRQRMGWKFPWVSSHDSGFNYDFHASSTPEDLASGKILHNFAEVDSSGHGEEHHGLSVFYRKGSGEIYLTYSCFSRGVDILCGTHNLLDLTPPGRNERGTMDWMRRHDEYEGARSTITPRITPFLWFDGNAEEAVQFYTSIFANSRITSTTHYPEVGAAVSGQTAGSVMTIAFQLDGQDFIAINGGPQFPFSCAVSFVVNCRTQDEVDYYREKLSTGGVGEAQQCGWLADKYGLSWQIVPVIIPELMGSTDSGIPARTMEAVLGMKKIDIAALRESVKVGE